MSVSLLRNVRLRIGAGAAKPGPAIGQVRLFSLVTFVSRLFPLRIELFSFIVIAVDERFLLFCAFGCYLT